MDYKEQNKIIIISYIVSISANFIINIFIVNLPDLNVLINSLRVTSILTFWWLFYFKYGWKLPIVKWIIFRVNLNGTWFGKYQSFDSKNQEYRGEIGIRIKQNFLTISLKSFTRKFDNYSYSEDIRHDEKSGAYGVVYVYSQKENSVIDTYQRNGTSELMLKEVGDKLYLEGTFWTVHGTKGKLSVRRITEKQIDTFEEAKNISKSK
jgi:hypothetical protein